MAERYVRRALEDFINANFATPYYTSVNLDEDPADATWCSIDWGVSLARRLTFCNEQEYDGTFQLLFFGIAGQGDDALLTSSELDVNLLKTFADPGGRLVLNNFSSAEDFRQDRWYAIAFTIEYLLHD